MPQILLRILKIHFSNNEGARGENITVEILLPQQNMHGLVINWGQHQHYNNTLILDTVSVVN